MLNYHICSGLYCFFCFAVVFDVYRDSQVSILMNSVIVNFQTCPMQTVLQSFFVCVSQGRVWLIDLNPFGEVTDSLLFSWEELTSGGEIAHQQVNGFIYLIVYLDICKSELGGKCLYLMRIVTLSPNLEYVQDWKKFQNHDMVSVCLQEGPAFRYTTREVTVQPSPCLSYRIPRDFVDLSTGEDAYKLIDFLKLVGLTHWLSVFSVVELSQSPIDLVFRSCLPIL